MKLRLKGKKFGVWDFHFFRGPLHKAIDISIERRFADFERHQNDWLIAALIDLSYGDREDFGLPAILKESVVKCT
jgi:hypothetical protein